MPMIRECIVTTLSEEGKVHIAPLGLIATKLQGEQESEGWIIAPFRPSTTLDNLRTTPFAVASFTDDVLVFAGCLTGNKDWPTRPATHVPGVVLDGALAHAELKVEAAILATRLHMLPREKVERELAYLQTAVEKTAGPREHEAWRLLIEKIEDHYKHASP
jgi:hypothetical protein